MSSIASRASWGARHRDGVGNRPTGNLERYFHHTVTTHLTASATVAQERAQMRAIEQIGQSRFGAGISYNFIVFPSGRIYQGASVGRIAYHSGPGRNVRGAAICLAGNYEANEMTRQQVEAVAWLIRRGVQNRWWTMSGRLIPHRSFSSTACSGKHSIAQIPAIERLAASGGGSTPARPPQEEDMPLNNEDKKWLREAISQYPWERQARALGSNVPAESTGDRLGQTRRLVAENTLILRQMSRVIGDDFTNKVAAKVAEQVNGVSGVDPKEIDASIRSAVARLFEDLLGATEVES